MLETKAQLRAQVSKNHTRLASQQILTVVKKKTIEIQSKIDKNQPKNNLWLGWKTVKS